MRQVLFKMLREAGLLTTDNQITPALLSPRLIQVIAQENPPDILIFPAFEFDLMQWAQ